jgi:hypothetical protein
MRRARSQPVVVVVLGPVVDVFGPVVDVFGPVVVVRGPVVLVVVDGPVVLVVVDGPVVVVVVPPFVVVGRGVLCGGGRRRSGIPGPLPGGRTVACSATMCTGVAEGSGSFERLIAPPTA